MNPKKPVQRALDPWAAVARLLPEISPLSPSLADSIEGWLGFIRGAGPAPAYQGRQPRLQAWASLASFLVKQPASVRNLGAALALADSLPGLAAWNLEQAIASGTPERALISFAYTLFRRHDLRSPLGPAYRHHLRGDQADLGILGSITLNRSQMRLRLEAFDSDGLLSEDAMPEPVRCALASDHHVVAFGHWETGHSSAELEPIASTGSGTELWLSPMRPLIPVSPRAWLDQSSFFMQHDRLATSFQKVAARLRTEGDVYAEAMTIRAHAVVHKGLALGMPVDVLSAVSRFMGAADDKEVLVREAVALVVMGERAGLFPPAFLGLADDDDESSYAPDTTTTVGVGKGSITGNPVPILPEPPIGNPRPPPQHAIVYSLFQRQKRVASITPLQLVAGVATNQLESVRFNHGNQSITLQFMLLEPDEYRADIIGLVPQDKGVAEVVIHFVDGSNVSLRNFLFDRPTFKTNGKKILSVSLNLEAP